MDAASSEVRDERLHFSEALHAYCEAASECTDEFELSDGDTTLDEALTLCSMGLHEMFREDYALEDAPDGHPCFVALADTANCMQRQVCGAQNEDCISAPPECDALRHR